MEAKHSIQKSSVPWLISITVESATQLPDFHHLQNLDMKVLCSGKWRWKQMPLSWEVDTSMPRKRITFKAVDDAGKSK